MGKHHNSEGRVAAQTNSLLLLLDPWKKDTFCLLLVCCFAASLAVKAGLPPKTSLNEA